jgi:CspA family cold shock protein
MAYQDTWAVCTRCGRQFIFRVEDQRRQAEQGEEITPPELCPSCRASSSGKRPREPERESRAQPERSRESAPAVLGPGPHEGHVKWYDREKGYGFIVHPTGEEIFFHRTGIASGETPDFADGTQVTYCVEETEKGPQAVDVERMDV